MAFVLVPLFDCQYVAFSNREIKAENVVKYFSNWRHRPFYLSHVQHSCVKRIWTNREESKEPIVKLTNTELYLETIGEILFF